jgi:hypothetical protein
MRQISTTPKNTLKIINEMNIDEMKCELEQIQKIYDTRVSETDDKVDILHDRQLILTNNLEILTKIEKIMNSYKDDDDDDDDDDDGDGDENIMESPIVKLITNFLKKYLNKNNIMEELTGINGKIESIKDEMKLNKMLIDELKKLKI